MAEARECPQCGAELPPDTSQGLCPRCLVEAGLSVDSESVLDSELTLPATPEGFDRSDSAVDPSSETLPTRDPGAVSEVPGG